MEETSRRIPGYFKNKGILITGATGFLGQSKQLAVQACLSCLMSLLICMHACIVLSFTASLPLSCMHCADLRHAVLAAVLVEKILRVQPDVKRIYLPVRAPDAASAKKRLETEVTTLCSIHF